jgi:tripartite-type tricarboxylate transporter receptor subunit TctC
MIVKLFLYIIIGLFPIFGFAKEIVTLYIATAPNQPNAALYIKTILVANTIQDNYEFQIEFKPGANGTIALKTMDIYPSNRLATVAPAFVENAKQGLINESDYIPISSQGDACWAIITNIGDTKTGIESLNGVKEVVVGGTGFGNASHITAIMLGEKYGFNVRYIVYKGNFDALVNMVGTGDINFVIERVSNFKNFKTRNPNLQILGINCPTRSSAMPDIKTLREQGIDSPSIFFAIVANVKMPADRRKELSVILQNAQAQLGPKVFDDISDLVPPQFSKPPLSVENFFEKRVSQMKYLTHKYKDKIDSSR